MTEIIGDSELIVLVIETDWENDFIIKTDIFSCLGSTKSLVGNLLHAGHNFFTVSRWRLSHHDLLKLIKVLHGVLLSGNHVLEIYGSSGCCDNAYDFQFSVNGAKTMLMTAANLNTCYANAKPKPTVE
jgi:hypothetical protein